MHDGYRRGLWRRRWTGRLIPAPCCSVYRHIPSTDSRDQGPVVVRGPADYGRASNNPAKTPLADGVGGVRHHPRRPAISISPACTRVESTLRTRPPYLRQASITCKGATVSSPARTATWSCARSDSRPVLPSGATGNGMLVYNSGGGPFNVGANGDVNLLGASGPPILQHPLLSRQRRGHNGASPGRGRRTQTHRDNLSHQHTVRRHEPGESLPDAALAREPLEARLSS